MSLVKGGHSLHEKLRVARCFISDIPASSAPIGKRKLLASICGSSAVYSISTSSIAAYETCEVTTIILGASIATHRVHTNASRR